MLVEKKHERRQFQRVDIPFKLLHAPFVFPGLKNPKMVPGILINVSAIGIFFRSSIDYKPGSMIRIEIKMGSWDRYKIGYNPFQKVYQSEPFVALGKINRCKKNGDVEDVFLFEAAAKYVSVDEGHQQAVARFISRLIQERRKGL